MLKISEVKIIAMDMNGCLLEISKKLAVIKKGFHSFQMITLNRAGDSVHFEKWVEENGHVWFSVKMGSMYEAHF